MQAVRTRGPPGTTTAPEATSTDTASISSPHTSPASERSKLEQRRCDGLGVAVTEWLVDNSALVRLAGSPDAALWAIERGLVRITTVLIADITGQPTERLRA